MAELRPPGPGVAASDALKIFISYSRQDQAAADALVMALETHGFIVTIDRRDLPYGEEWQKELTGLIAASDAIVWLVSPHSIKSPWCNWELSEAVRLSKRLVPVRIQEIDPDGLPDALGKIHLLPARAVYDPKSDEGDLVATLNTDRPWLKKGTSLGEDARDWIASGRDGARLLRGTALSEAESWSVRTPREAPTPSSDIVELILASRRAQRRRQRMTVTGSIAASIVAIVLAAAAVWFGLRAEEQAAEARKQSTIAIANETVSLAALSRVAVSEHLPVHAVKLVLAAWPAEANRSSGEPAEAAGDVGGGARTALRPQMWQTVESIALVLPRLREIFTYSGHRGLMSNGVFSTDGAQALTASDDGSIRIWDAASGTDVTVLDQKRADIAWVGLSPDGSTVGALFADAVHLLDARSGAQIRELADRVLISAAFSPDGRYVAAGSRDEPTIRIWDLASEGKPRILTREFGGEANSLVFSRDGRFLVSGSANGKAYLWDLQSGSSTIEFEGHTNVVTAVDISRQGNRVLTASWDGTARIWETIAGMEVLALHGSCQSLSAAAFSPDGSIVALGCEDGVVYLRGVQEGKDLGTFEGHAGRIASVAFSPDGGRLLSTSADGTARMWQLDPAREILALDGHTNDLTSAVYSTDGQWIATGSWDHTARVWDARTGQSIAVARHADKVSSVAFSPDGRLLATASGDGTAALWDVSAGRQVAVLEGHSDGLNSVSFSPDGRTLVTASLDGSARLWNVADGSSRLQIRGHQGSVVSAAFSLDGKSIATGSQDGTARLWLATDGSETKKFTVGAAVTMVARSPDGTALTIASDDGAVRTWDVDSGNTRVTITAQGPSVTGLAYSSDGSRIVTVSSDRTARIWDAATGAELAVLRGSANIVGSAAFSPTEPRLVTVGVEGARIWDFSTLERGDAFQIACQRLGNNTSLKDVQGHYGLGELTPICGDNRPLPVDWLKLQ
jgi:WD40 repeat protein